jgi:DNA (cytosine-5)-methyltransferase 1
MPKKTVKKKQEGRSLQRLVSGTELEPSVATERGPVRSGAGGVLKHKPQATHLDLFSSIGGFAIAARAAGFRTIAFSEIEPYACKILERHWPDVPNLGDIRNVRGVRANLVTGGFPCQPFSRASAGKRLGKNDDRYLWPEMLRVIAESGADWVLGENVAGLDGMALCEVVSDLEAIGYTVAPPLEIPACAVGHDHRRERLWILAHANVRAEHGSAIDAETQVLPECEHEAGRLGAADGVSRGMDRLRRKALGNAIVPQIALQILRGIAAINAGGGGAEQAGDDAATKRSGACSANEPSSPTKSDD